MMSIKANKGEWSEPYVAIRILGEGKLYLSDENVNKNNNEWMDVLELIRNETASRIVTYKYNAPELIVDIYVNEKLVVSIPANEFLEIADNLAEEITTGTGNSFNVSENITDFFSKIEITHIKAKSINKSDVFLTIRDPRASIIRKHIGFSIKSEFGKDPTLFNTAKASAAVYKVIGMTDELMEEINQIFDTKGHVAVSERCDTLIQNNCKLIFDGFPIAARAGVAAFEENLDLIDSRLVNVIDYILKNHFIAHERETDLNIILNNVINENPCNISRPEIKYPYMVKSFLYAAYCGMTASTLWDGTSQINGGFIKVSSNGDVLAYYALESDAFKTYLINNCYLEFPSTDEGHGNYGKIYKENDSYYFRLNFQIRYR